MNLTDLENRIRRAWSRSTTRYWQPDNPAWGQCAVTALAVQDELGGILLRASVKDGDLVCSHYWNQLPDGSEVDLTREQFASFEYASTKSERTREYILSFPDTVLRYRALKRRLDALR